MLNDFYFDGSSTPNNLTLPLNFANMDPNKTTNRVVSGLFNPLITMRPRSTKFFMVANVGSDIYYNLSFSSNSVMNIIAQDGVRQNQITPASFYLLGPGSRVEFLFTAPAKAKTIKLVTLKMSTGPDGEDFPRVELATLKVAGKVVANPVKLPPSSAFPPLLDLRTVAITTTRTFVFQYGGKVGFTINQKVFAPDRVDVTVKLGSTERWVLINKDTYFHAFHIHQGSFQIDKMFNVSQPFYGHVDTALMPGNSTVEVIIPFVDNVILGKYVFHCHILKHEDMGMMQVVQVEN